MLFVLSALPVCSSGDLSPRQGIPKGVDSMVHQLHVKGVAEVWKWSPPIPSPVGGEVIRILIRYFAE